MEVIFAHRPTLVEFEPLDERKDITLAPNVEQGGQRDRFGFRAAPVDRGFEIGPAGEEVIECRGRDAEVMRDLVLQGEGLGGQSLNAARGDAMGGPGRRPWDDALAFMVAVASHLFPPS